MKLGELTFPKGARKKAKRVARGAASGTGKTAGRGHKGARARSGYSLRPGYEGGQMPLYRRVPKFGFKNPFRVEYATVNVASLDVLFEEGAVVGPEELRERNLVRRGVQRVKILGDGELTKKLTVRAHKFSRTADEKIRGAGGAVEVI